MMVFPWPPSLMRKESQFSLSKMHHYTNMELRNLTHWGRVTHICVSKLTIIGTDNGLSPGRRQAIIWTNDGIWLIRPLGINFSEILIGIQTFSFQKMHLQMSSAKCRPSCLGLNVITGKPSLRSYLSLTQQQQTHWIRGLSNTGINTSFIFMTSKNHKYIKIKNTVPTAYTLKHYDDCPFSVIAWY